jgi:PAS domain S-box-containing protein
MCSSSNEGFVDSEALTVEGGADGVGEEELELHRRLNLTPSMLSVIEPDGRYTWVNDVALQYFGLSAADIASDDLRRRVVHPDDFQSLREERQRFLANNVPFEYENRLRRHDGQFRWFLVRYQPLKDAAGRVVRWYGGAIDIEDRKRAEEALRRSEAYLAEAQKLTHTGSSAIDPTTGKTTYWSEEMFRIHGIEPSLGVPGVEEDVSRFIHQEDIAGVREAFERAAREKAEYAQDYRIVLPGGTVKHLHAIGHPVLDKTGEPIEYFCTIADVTERKRAEEGRERLRHLEAELARINRASTLGELAASLAHEIKQPIAAAVLNARTCARWLKRAQPDLAEAVAAAGRLVGDATRAADIIDRVRSLYQVGPARRERVDVNDLVREIVLMQHGVDRHRVRVGTELADGLPPLIADRVQLQQVLLNLVLNGMEAMRDEPGTLLIATRRNEEGDVRVSVSDSGMGLPAGDAERLFEAFFTTKPQGTGMGLAISRSVVQAHGGRLWATANAGRGATFHFTLPVPAEPAEAANRNEVPVPEA